MNSEARREMDSESTIRMLLECDELRCWQVKFLSEVLQNNLNLSRTRKEIKTLSAIFDEYQTWLANQQS